MNPEAAALLNREFLENYTVSGMSRINSSVEERLNHHAGNEARRLSDEAKRNLLSQLKERFEKNIIRHKGLEWSDIQIKLEANDKKLWSLSEMERTGGEPDVIGIDHNSGEYVFADCSAESPKGRRSICYDQQGQDEREKNGVYPQGNAVGMAAAFGIELLSEEQYKELQKIGKFDSKTSSWLKTPADIRNAGGAIFADFRYGHVFIYHNSAPSFYGSRGFRGILKI